jgi:pyrroloquinoline quinone biosynthesis protein D
MGDEPVGQQALAQHIRPRLVAKARMQIDKVSGEPVLLYPEGLLLLNTTGAAIIQLCDGKHTFLEIVMELAAQYNISSEVLRSDVGDYLVRLHKCALMDFNL